MQSQELKTILAPFGRVVDPRAVTAGYRCLELSTNAIRGAAYFGALRRKIALGVEGTCFVNGATLIGVVASLPEGHEVSLEIRDGALAWTCGPTAGRIATVEAERPPSRTPTRRGPAAGFRPTADFVAALGLGAVSYDDKMAEFAAVAVCFDRGFVTSCDNATVAIAPFVPPETEIAPVAWFSDKTLDVLSNIIDPDRGRVELTDEVLQYRDALWAAEFTTSAAPAREQFITYERMFSGGTDCVPLPRDALQAFINRINAMAEVRRLARVWLGVVGGKLVFKFSEDTSESEEYYTLGTGTRRRADVPLYSVRALHLARALKSVDEIVFDHLPRAIMFRNRESGFVYVISGAPGE